MAATPVTISAQIAELATVSSQMELAYDPAELRGHDGKWVTDPAKALRAIAGIRAAGSAGESGPGNATSLKAVTDFTAKAAHAVPGLLGGGHEVWNGQAELFPAADRPSLLAEIDWNGKINYQDGVAKSIQEAAVPGTSVRDPSAFSVVLHELIHGTIPEGETYRQHMAAYQDKNAAMIEEGFTELGTAHHMPGFLDSMGVGRRKTRVIAAKDGHAVEDPKTGKLKRATMAEYAKRLQDPERVAKGDAWGHYPQQTAAAQQWVRMVALEEAVTAPSGKLKADAMANGTAGPVVQARMRTLADEINRQGPAGKTKAMAAQVMRVTGVQDQPTDAGNLAELAAETVRKNWAMGSAAAAFQATARLARQFHTVSAQMRVA